MPTLPLYDSLAGAPATREAINAERDRREVAPIEVMGRIYDCDEKAENRFRQALEVWDELGQASIEWTLADNTRVTLTQAELAAVHQEIVRARALRGLQIHQVASALKDQLPNVTLRDVASAPWP